MTGKYVGRGLRAVPSHRAGDVAGEGADRVAAMAGACVERLKNVRELEKVFDHPVLRADVRHPALGVGWCKQGWPEAGGEVLGGHLVGVGMRHDPGQVLEEEDGGFDVGPGQLLQAMLQRRVVFPRCLFRRDDQLGEESLRPYIGYEIRLQAPISIR